MVTRDGVVIRVRVFASGIWGITLKGCIVGAGRLGIGVILPLLGSLGGSPLLPVAEMDGPPTCGLPVTSQILASRMGVHMFRGGK